MLDLPRTPLLLEAGILARARQLGVKLVKKGITAVRRARTPEFVRHCVTAISQDSKKVAKIARKGTVHGICRATYNRNKQLLGKRHPKGMHHTASEYRAAADKIGEGVIP